MARAARGAGAGGSGRPAFGLFAALACGMILAGWSTAAAMAAAAAMAHQWYAATTTPPAGDMAARLRRELRKASRKACRALIVRRAATEVLSNRQARSGHRLWAMNMLKRSAPARPAGSGGHGRPGSRRRGR